MHAYDTVLSNLSIYDLAQGEQFPEPLLDPSILNNDIRITANIYPDLFSHIIYLHKYRKYKPLSLSGLAPCRLTETPSKHDSNGIDLYVCAINYRIS